MKVSEGQHLFNSSYFGPHPPEIAGQPARIIPCTASSTILGRHPKADVVLSDPAVAPRHAVAGRNREGCWIADVGGNNGTFVNGHLVERAHLKNGDAVTLGSYQFHYRDMTLVWIRPDPPLTLTAVGLYQTTDDGVNLLNDVSFTAKPATLVGLLGPSGAGKTTLLDTLSGRLPAERGKVLLRGEELYERFERFRHLLGYVPQRDIVHPELTPRQALTYVARLRLPPDVDHAELAVRVVETLAILDLHDRADIPIHRLSGGQRKRVSVGVELLNRPSVIFLDEPTAGLDPSSAFRLVRTLQGLAHQGRTVICATHVMEDVSLFDHVVVLAPGGCLAFAGPPNEALQYFKVDRFVELYDRLEQRSGDRWRRRFARSKPGTHLRAAVVREASPRHLHDQASLPTRPERSELNHWVTLTARFGRILASDPALIRLVLLQPIALSGLTCLAFIDLPIVLFMLIVAAIWQCCSLAAQQIVRERDVYQRERMVNLRLVSYVLSKFFPLTLVGVAQAGLMLGVVALWGLGGGLDWAAAFAGLTLAGWNGTAMGLLVSAIAPTAERATALVPLIVLPQIILGGVLICLPDMNGPTKVASAVAPARWANQVMEVAWLNGRHVDESLFADKANLWPLWNLHQTYDFREPKGRTQFLKDNAGGLIQKRQYLSLDYGLLSVGILAQFVILALLLRHQDPL